MLKAEIGLDVVKSWMRELTAVTDDGVLNITPEGVDTIAVDISNVAMVKCEMPMSEFEEYKCSGDADEEKIGVDLARLLSVLNTLKGDDHVNLVVDDKKIELKYGNLEYSLATLSEDAIRRSPKMPEMDHAACVSLSATKMRGILAAAAKIADICTMQIGSDGNGGHNLCFSADGEMDNLRYDLTEADDISFEFVNKNVKSTFSLDYLTTLFKAPTGQVKLYLGDCQPLKTTFNGHAKVEYLLAPRIDSDEYEAAQSPAGEAEEEVEQASEIVNKTEIGAKVEENEASETTQIAEEDKGEFFGDVPSTDAQRSKKSAIDIALEQMRGEPAVGETA